ncbi:hypothetical protein [Halocynthiibacter styelae]|uniref:Uncharacterized protein n=1 Tax=Halocynthiibacter styelae TaxID=2761955 RepID=A0A8J7ICG3_9RHOB|nr:hypothetical protein [Paenihalocynthiibacter styelae]MBI1493288.1 hypothetical protein [Paenihalocynthiibacter styelae]
MMAIGKAILDYLPEFKLPEMTREAEIAVYMVHNSAGAEDYVFLFDFEEFKARSEAGMFVRPVIRIFAGRDDFSRLRFARQFREVFAAEFDRMRAEAGETSGGWLNWGIPGTNLAEKLGGFIANLLLAIALGTGKQILNLTGLAGLLRGKSDEAKLVDEFEKTRCQVEEALSRVEITIHPELYDYAYRDGLKGKISRMDRDAWPLPAYVREHLRDAKSGSWW